LIEKALRVCLHERANAKAQGAKVSRSVDIFNGLMAAKNKVNLDMVELQIK